MAAEAGLAGIVLSNHGPGTFSSSICALSLLTRLRPPPLFPHPHTKGGRQLDFAPSGIEILPEVMDALKRRGLNRPDFEV
jgi:isopentenyl diphosphate isomerase/L-lactate dehydrogenase-like FMN-dependent dehydrogenase